MELIWLQDFLALCANRSFSRAADQRNITQPAFSRRIHSLEEWMGVKLFDRSTHPVSLTQTGNWFRPVAEDLLHRILVTREEALAVSEDVAATLHFAATHVLSWSFFPAWLRNLEGRLSHLHIGPIRLTSNTLNACEELMLRGGVQFLLCHYHPDVSNRLDSAHFQSVQIGDDIMLPVATPSEAERLSGLDPNQIPSPIHLLTYSDESGLGQIVRALNQRHFQELKPQPMFTSHLAVVLRAMAIEGRGMAWLPKSLIADDLAARRLVEMSQWFDIMPVEIRLFRRRAADSPRAEIFWRLFEPVSQQT